MDIRFLWAVTAVVWLGTLYFVVLLLRRQRKLQAELDALEKSFSELQNTSVPL